MIKFLLKRKQAGLSHEPLDSKPELTLIDQFYWGAFQRLSRQRTYDFGGNPQSIPIASIKTYAEIYCVDNLVRFYEVMIHMDDMFIETHYAALAKQEEQDKKPVVRKRK